MLDREKIIQEVSVRLQIYNVLKEIRKNEKKELQVLQSSIQTMFEQNETPEESTAMSFLRDLLNDILTNIEEGYSDLTSKKEERDSYRQHLLKAIKDALNIEKINRNKSLGESEYRVIKKDIEDDPFYIELDDEDEESKFLIKGLDKTGGIQAKEVFDLIKTKIITAFRKLFDPREQDEFILYLIKNLDLHMNTYEDNLSGVSDETPEEF
jgi:hypothetical protein